jgi:signal transduction histidine kinase
MPGGGTLTITTRSSGQRAFLRVTDTGVGMTADVQRHLFVPFFSTKDVGQGTGLGLAVVHGIVTAHGGAIDVKSEPGRGSSFEIAIPVQAGAATEVTT